MIHGLLAGTLFLLAFAGGLAGMWSLRPGFLTPVAVKERLRRLYVGVWVMAAVSWITVISGVDRLPLVPGGVGRRHVRGVRGSASSGPRPVLTEGLPAVQRVGPDARLARVRHGVEGARRLDRPVLATAVAFIVTYYGARLIPRTWLRVAVIVMFVTAFAAAVGGAFGAFLNKVAPIV